MLHIILHALLALTANQRNKKKTWGPFQVLIFFSIDYYGVCNIFEIVRGTSLHQCKCSTSELLLYWRENPIKDLLSPTLCATN